MMDQSVFLMYELKNGKRLAREYHLQNYDSYMPLLAKIYESSEYKKTVNELLNVSTEDVSKIKITASGQVDKSVNDYGRSTAGRSSTGIVGGPE